MTAYQRFVNAKIEFERTLGAARAAAAVDEGGATTADLFEKAHDAALEMLNLAEAWADGLSDDDQHNHWPDAPAVLDVFLGHLELRKQYESKHGITLRAYQASPGAAYRLETLAASFLGEDEAADLQARARSHGFPVTGFAAAGSRRDGFAPLGMGADVDVILKGGGAKGAAHVGAVETLRHGFNVRTFSGTSAGAIAATLFATGMSAGGVLAAIRAPLSIIRGDARNSPVGWRDMQRLAAKHAIFDTAHLAGWLDTTIRQQLLANGAHGISQRVTFEELAEHAVANLIIFATDTTHGIRSYGFVSKKCVGDCASTYVSDAVVASMSIPFVFRGSAQLSTTLIDGGILANFPAAETYAHLRQAGLRPNPIGVVLTEPQEVVAEESLATQAARVLGAATDARDAHLVRDLRRAGRLVEIDTAHYRTLDFHMSGEDQETLRCLGLCAARGLAIDVAKSESELPKKPRFGDDDTTSDWGAFQGALAKLEAGRPHRLAVSTVRARAPRWMSLGLLAAFFAYRGIVLSALAVVAGLGGGLALAVAYAAGFLHF